jgi:hypothetical protein
VGALTGERMSNVGETVEFFLRDLFAFLIPGAVLMGGARLAIGPDWQTVLEGRVELPPQSVGDWILAGLGAYVIGYILQSIGMQALRYFDRRVDSLPKLLSLGESEAKLHKVIGESPTFQSVRDRLEELYGVDLSAAPIREARNLAMSVPNVRLNEVYRTMYMSQLCLGSATALVVGAIAVFVTFTIARVIHATVPGESLVWALAFLLAAPLLIERRYRFFSISTRLPFAIALAALPTASRSESAS